MKNADLLRNLFIMALADGSMDPEELEALAEHRARWGMDENQFEAIQREAQSPNAQLHIPDDPADRYQLLTDMAAIMAADGQFTDLEKATFALAAVRLDISQNELDQILEGLSENDDDLLLEEP